MHSPILLFPLLGLLLPAFAVPTQRAHTWSKTLQVTANSTGKKIIVPPPSSTIDVTEFLIAAFAPNPLGASIVSGPLPISGTFGISAHAYIPRNPSTTCFFATHGIGAYSAWWDFKVDNDNTTYSFVDVANAQGYPVFSYDRLGVGKSDRPDGINVVQSSLHVSIAHELLHLIRTNQIPNLTCKKIVAIGHSFGSFVTVGLAAQYGNDAFDAAVLTGFSAYGGGIPSAVTAFHSSIASQVQGKLKGLMDTSYWLWDNAVAGHIGFLHYPGVTPAAAAAFEASKQSYTMGELGTLEDPVVPSQVYSGPVVVVTGQYDTIFCGGNCYGGSNGTSILPDVAQLFPKVKKFSSKVVEGTAHGLPVHTSAPDTHGFIVDWVKGLGL